MSTAGKCTGACCRSFYLSASLVTLRAIVDSTRDPEAARIFAIVRPTATPAPAGAPGQIVTCAVWDPETKRCRQYDVRPRMCRAYPEVAPCEHCGATTPAEASVDV